MTELKRCPFCGSEPRAVFGPDEHLGSCWVECWGPSDDICCGHWHFEGSREETAAAWNRRAAAALTSQEPHP